MYEQEIWECCSSVFVIHLRFYVATFLLGNRSESWAVFMNLECGMGMLNNSSVDCPGPSERLFLIFLTISRSVEKLPFFHLGLKEKGLLWFIFILITNWEACRGQRVSLLPGAKRKMVTHDHHESFQHPRKKSQLRTMFTTCFFLFLLAIMWLW